MRTRAVTVAAIVSAMVLGGLPLTPGAHALTAQEVAKRVASLRASLDAVGTRLDRAEVALENINAAIVKHSADLAAARTQRRTLHDVIARRAAALYMYGTDREIKMVGTVDDLERMAYLQQMAQGEQSLLEQITIIQRSSNEASTALKADRAHAAAQYKEMNARRTELFGKLHELSQLLRFLDSISGRPNLRGSRGARGMVCPVSGYQYIDNNFGDPRPGGPHTGDDIPATYGTPVRAVLPATVVNTPTGGWMGIGIIIRDLSGTEWWYAHLSRRVVSVGEHVAGGEYIGNVGCSGNCSGPHLHFEYHPGGGDPANPYRILKAVC